MGQYFVVRASIKMGGGETPYFGRSENPHNMFTTLNGAIEIAVRSKKPNAVALVKWLAKKVVEEIQEEHHHQQTKQFQQAITDRRNQIQGIQYEKVGLQDKIQAKDQ